MLYNEFFVVIESKILSHTPRDSGTWFLVNAAQTVQTICRGNGYFLSSQRHFESHLMIRVGVVKYKFAAHHPRSVDCGASRISRRSVFDRMIPVSKVFD